MPPPTAEELAAWDRKSDEAEAPLHEWDRAHIDALSSWWRELQVSDERWTFVVNRLDRYLPKVGAVHVALDRENPDDLAACRSFLDSL